MKNEESVTAAFILPCHLLIIDELEIEKKKNRAKVKLNRQILPCQIPSNISEMLHITTRGQDDLTVIWVLRI